MRARDYVRRPELRLVAIISGLCTHYGKMYVFPSQEKLLQLLAKRYGVKMSLRTLNRHLGALERDFYIRRVRRHKLTRGPTGPRLLLRSTLYKMTARSIGWTKRFLRSFVRRIEPVDNSPDRVPLFAVPFLAQQLVPILGQSFAHARQ